MGLAVYLLVTQPSSWGINAIWVVVGLILYRTYTFKKEIDVHSPLITSEGDLAKKEYRNLIPFTPENPDRLLKHAIRVVKENDGELSVLRIITLPKQTQLSAGTAFAEAATKSFDSIEKILVCGELFLKYIFETE